MEVPNECEAMLVQEIMSLECFITKKVWWRKINEMKICACAMWLCCDYTNCVNITTRLMNQ